MSRLSEILDQMTVVLNDLKTVMDAEQQHLSSGHLEQQRRAEQDPKRSANDDIVERWQTITEKTQHLRDLNQHNGWLLEGQIERNQQALEVLKPHKETGLYGADGQTATARIAGVKKISI
jgi:flagella synthesis protein FlgN